MRKDNALSTEFVRQVRNALAHLYDHAYLQNHPLAALVDPCGDLDRVTRGQRLRRLLLDCIETLRPQAEAAASQESARAHSMLTFRYVDGVPLKEIAAMRALGSRQAYREVQRGVQAVARILQERLAEGRQLASSLAALQGDAGGDPLLTAQAEVARLQQTVHSETLNLFEITQGVLDLLRPITERTGVRIRLATPPPWPPALGDRVMLRQALLNLFTYALDSVARGDLIASVSPAATGLCLEISESPTVSRICPISPPTEAQAQVSLPVGQALLQAQSGRLETRRTEGRWQARVLLPVPGRQTILVIDDNQDLVSLLQRYLAGHDLQVVGASDGEQALRLADELQPRLITLDVMMPNLDGWEVLQRLESGSRTARIPVIICSVLHARELAQSAGASGYIGKPVRQEELLQLLRRWLGPLPPAG
jgi:CheY-like chemotaxis protein